MSIGLEDAFDRKRRVFLDSAPVIYALGEDPLWSKVARSVIRHCIEQGIQLVASPVTLAECLAGESDATKQRNFIDFILRTSEVEFAVVDDVVGIQAGLLRQRRGWRLPDCLQIAFALRHACDGFLTNDSTLFGAGLATDVVLLSDLA